MHDIEIRMSDLWFILFVILVINSASVQGNKGQRARQFKQRCTRRFTPGVCINPISPAWTFNYQLMNCTERLGCPQTARSNRFVSYERCMQRCQPMVDLYLQILAYRGDTSSRFFLRKIPGPAILGEGTVLNPPPPASDDDYYPGDEALLARVMYPDARPGLDDVPDARDADDYLEIHDPART